MSMTRVNSPAPAVTMRGVDLPLGTARSNYVGSVTAPTVSGYTFLCWVQCVTNNWVGSAYAEPVNRPTAYVWVPKPVAEDAEHAEHPSITCWAMYVRS